MARISARTTRIVRARPASEEAFRDAMGRFVSGVTVITTVDHKTPFGTTASAIASVSLTPPMLLICMNRSSATGEAIARSGHFAVNILDESQSELARHFASKGGDKFSGVELTYSQYGEPLLLEALAVLECRVVNETRGGTHSVFLAEVECVRARPGAPLVYFRGKFGRIHFGQDETGPCGLVS